METLFKQSSENGQGLGRVLISFGPCGNPADISIIADSFEEEITVRKALRKYGFLEPSLGNERRFRGLQGGTR